MTEATATDSQDGTSSSKNSSSPSEPKISQHRMVQRRTRTVLTCGPCRVRKLKCDRAMPCGPCTKRDQATACSYETSGGKISRFPAKSAARSEVVQNKIDRLEKLVLSLMNSSSNTTPKAKDLTISLDGTHQIQPHEPQISPTSDSNEGYEKEETDGLAQYFGQIQFSDNGYAYVGDSHWATILHELSEVRSHLAGYENDYRSALDDLDVRQTCGPSQGPAFLLAGHSPFGLTELIHRLPKRTVMDQLVERYFGSDHDLLIYILHGPSWRRRYDSFWRQGTSENSDPAFVAQLFAICGLAMQSYSETHDEPFEFTGRTRDLAAMYRGLTQQSLQLVDYAKLGQTTVETFIMCTYAEYQRPGVADVDIWVLLRTTISLAMRLGMHRDPTNFPSVTPFQGELRRRQWAFLRMADVIWSFTVGLPFMIKESDTDTQLPLNLNDSDFDETTQTMPPAHPKAELTNSSYLIAKTIIACVFAKIIAAVTGIGSIDYEDVVKLNVEIHDVYQNISPALQMRLFDVSNQDDSKNLLLMQLDLSVLYNKAVCVLHRRYLTVSRKTPRFKQSRQACVDAALVLLRIQQLVSNESQFGNQMDQLQAHVLAFMTHDCILAATLIGLDVLATLELEVAGQKSGDLEIWGADRKEEEIQALEQACMIWSGLQGQHIEATKAFKMCSIMIQNIHQLRMSQMSRDAAAQPNLTPTSTASGNIDNGQSNNAVVATSNLFDGSMTGNYGTDAYLTPQAAGRLDSGGVNLGSEFADPLTGLDAFSFPIMQMEGLEGIDWNMWDEYIQNTGFTSL